MFIETPFMMFWRAINRSLESQRLPTLKFADARAQWKDATDSARLLAEKIAFENPPAALEEIRFREVSSAH